MYEESFAERRAGKLLYLIHDKMGAVTLHTDFNDFNWAILMSEIAGRSIVCSMYSSKRNSQALLALFFFFFFFWGGGVQTGNAECSYTSKALRCYGVIIDFPIRCGVLDPFHSGNVFWQWRRRFSCITRWLMTAARDLFLLMWINFNHTTDK